VCIYLSLLCDLRPDVLLRWQSHSVTPNASFQRTSNTMSEPVIKTTHLSEIRRLLNAGVQPTRVDIIDGKFLLFTFPASAALTVGQ
jgi:hypothetical protein